ncbi:uncharacterized protein F4812DRAFT_447529 [Daldinia caldariorum]|uniref:uncharacterized protein n=1 Tax=Daldinia caldariorum TaxID=326644 RepID=UPI002008A4B3|nr:uncharacterized protein F4812DRAFT_447529 [Daldinia caldariorum]KAI1463221.1 hypothetical protein F4812DRAFT_447529 [Daldinia caldariorum]
MHAFTYFVLSLVAVAHGLPAFLAEHKRDDILKLDPTIDLGLDVNNKNSCFGLGISVCDPITVDSQKSSTVVKKNNNNNNNNRRDNRKDNDNNDIDNNNSNKMRGSDTEINFNPDIDLDLHDFNLEGDNSCFGIGLSVCDSIADDSDIDESTGESDSKAKAKANPPSSSSSTPTPTPSPAKAPATYSVQASPASSSPSSSPTTSPSSSSGGNSLIDVSPVIKPHLNLTNANSCQGVGISACDPITVDSIVKSLSS